MQEEKLYAYVNEEQHELKTQEENLGITIKNEHNENIEKKTFSDRINPASEKLNKGDFYTYTKRFDVANNEENKIPQSIKIIPSSIKAVKSTLCLEDDGWVRNVITLDVNVSDDLQSFSVLVPDEAEVKIEFDVEFDYKGERQIAYTEESFYEDNQGVKWNKEKTSDIRENPFTLSSLIKNNKESEQKLTQEAKEKILQIVFAVLLIIATVLTGVVFETLVTDAFKEKNIVLAFASLLVPVCYLYFIRLLVIIEDKK